jgi:tetratricopeptide (TPR) repeat protein
VLNLALARRRLAFASQLLPSGIIRKQTPESAVLRLTHAEMLAEREARLTVLQREEGKWTAEEHEAAVELAALQREIEAMEAIELELARAYGAVEAEMWTVKMKERVSSPRGGEAFRTASAHAQHQAAHRSRCLSGRGRCRLLLGCETEALQDFEAALVAFPESLEALWGKSEALDQLGRTAEATAALAKHDRLLSRQEGSSELESAPEEPDEELPMSGVSVSGVSDSDRSELVLPFFDAGLPAFHRVDALQPAASIARTDRKAGNTLTAKWMGRKTLLVLLAWQSWASGCVLFREQVKAVLRSARDVFTARNHERLAELSLVYELPLSAVASEQNRHGQLCTGAAEAMVGCEDLVRQKAAWQAGTGREPDLTGRQALLTEQKLALSVKYNERAHDLQGRLVQAHGKGVQATLVSMRRIVIAKAGTCDARGRTAKRALHNIQKEAVQVAAVDASVTGEPIRDKVVTMGPLFWTVMLGNLARNARKVEAALAAGKADSSDAVEPSRRTFASLAVAALADARLLSQDNKATAGIGQAPNDVLDVEIVRWVCSRVDLSLMWSWSEEAADKQSPSTAVEASDNDAADTEATLRRLERRLALVDLGITKSMWSGGSSWSGIDRQLIRHVLSFCEPPGLLAAAGSCRQIRAAMHDGGWDALQALRDTHVSVAVSQLGRIAASVSRRSDARSAGIERVGSLMAQTKRLLLGLDDMDLVTASLSHRPTTTLEFVCEALSQLLTLSEDGTDGAAAKPLAESQGSIQEDTNVEGHRDTSLAFLFKADADVYDPTSGTSRQRLKNRWEERSNSIETASVSMVSAQPANHWLESRRRYNRSTGSDSGANRRPGSGSSFLSSASSISLPSRPSSALASSYVSSLVHRHAHAQEEISHSLLLGLDPALPSTHEEEQDSLSSVVATEDGATKGTWWWKPASDGSDGGYDKSTDRAHTGMGSRWDLGSKALRTVVSTRLLELSEPGGGASFHALMMASTAARRATVRRLLPYTATLLGELQRRREEGALRDASIEGRVAAGLGSFVVAIDAQLRVSCGLCAEGEAVIAEAQATRVAELCKACAR